VSTLVSFFSPEKRLESTGKRIRSAFGGDGAPNESFETKIGPTGTTAGLRHCCWRIETGQREPVFAASGA
jgi:hypothetical protein